MRARILVVGGGIMGTSIALKAAQRTDSLGAPVVLLERRDIGAGSSGRSGAILRQHYAAREVATMARDSLREYAGFEARAGRSIGFERCGVLTLAGADQPEVTARIRDNVAMLSDMGIDTRIVEGAEMREVVPGIRVQEGAVGAWEPDSGVVEPGRTLEAMAALARSYGAVTRLGVEVTDVHVSDGKVVGATTTEGRYDAEQVVLVAGPWTGALLAKLGVEVPLKVIRPENHFVAMPHAEIEVEDEVEPRSGAIGFDISEDPSERLPDDIGRGSSSVVRGDHPVVIDLEQDCYCRCEPSSRRTRIGRTQYADDQELADPDDLDEEVSAETKAWAREAISARMPEYAEQPDVGSQAAWYTLTPDAQPVIGPVPGIEGLFLVAGFSGHGFKLAPSVGEGVAQMLFDEQVSAFDPEFFAPDRFQGDEEWTGRFGL